MSIPSILLLGALFIFLTGCFGPVKNTPVVITRESPVAGVIMPLQYPAGESADSIGLTGTETFDVSGIVELNAGKTPSTVSVTATALDGSVKTFQAVVRIDTPGEADYFRHGGILQYVLRSLAKA